jgi:hypothetical protein
MSWYPTYKLYANDGLTLVYTFITTSDNSPSDPIRFFEVTGSRGQGSIIVPGSKASWDLQLRFHLSGSNYQDVIAKIDLVESLIVPNTEYILKIQRTPSTTKDYNVKRIAPIQWDDDKRLFFQKGLITFRALSW